MGKNTEGAEAKSYNFFLSRGYPPHVAAAITGNLKHESGFNVGIEGDKGYQGGSSWGIAQFRGERLTRLKQQYGNNWKNLDNQLAFVDWELNNTEKAAGNALKGAKNVFEAGQIMSDKYERPQLKYHQNKGRQKDVNEVYRKFQDPNYVAPEYKADSQEQPQRTTGEYNTFDYEASKYYDSKESDRLNLTPNITNFNSQGLNSNFVEEEEEKGVSAVDKKKEQEAQQLLQQKTNEQNFLDDWSRTQEEYIASSNSNQGVQEQTQVQPQEDFTQTFNEISQFVDAPIAQQGGAIRDNAGQRVPISNRGMYDFPNQKVIVPTNGSITMKGVPHKIKGVSLETGEIKIMYPNLEYFFKDSKNIIETPI